MTEVSGEVAERMAELGFRVSVEELRAADELVTGLEAASATWATDAGFSTAGSLANRTDQS